MSLVKYKQKRSFDKTPEPVGKVKASKTKKLEFVVQKHHASHLHYDFRLELDGVLKSWAVPKGPSLNPEDKRLAMMVEDHPYEYRKFEGVIPAGNYGAGNVIIWDKGTYQPRQKTTQPEKLLSQQLKKGHLTFVLDGQKLKGEFALVKSTYKGENAWLLIKKKDEFASKVDITEQTQSVISGRLVDDLAAPKIDLSDAPETPMPLQLKPMLASLTDQPFDDKDWLFEVKWDGYRAVSAWDGQTVQLYSRNGTNFVEKYKPVSEALRSLSHKAVLDGEVVALDSDGKSNFGWLQNWAVKPQGVLRYMVFDILWCDGHDLTGLPLTERKKILQKVVQGSQAIVYSDHIQTSGRKFFKAAQSSSLEGIMAKNCQSIYRPGLRSRQWLKIKTHLRQEAVIGGFTEPRGSRKHLGALILGVYKAGKLRYIGHTGGGIPTKLMPQLRTELEKLEVSSSPFVDKFKPNAPAHWVEPKLICEISFSEWTSDSHMRQPIFVAMRDDKPASEVRREEPMPAKKREVSEPASSKQSGRLQFSHLDKVFFPDDGITKGDLINYYQSVGRYIMPYIKHRPHSLLRQPNGIEGESFFQKDMDHMPPDWVKTAPIYSESNKKDINYLVPEKQDHLLYMVQLGCIEINPWNSRIGKLDKPDWCVIDLDPEDIGFDQVVKVAQATHQVCQQLKIAHYPKTSGKTGIHIYIPLGAKYSYEQSKQFGQLIANLVQPKVAAITSLERSPKKRQKKIYLDFLQNRAGQTLAAPYSVRPTAGACVSTPLDWSEVTPSLKPQNFTIRNTLKRLDKIGDIWQPVLGKAVDIKKILQQLE